MSTFPTPTSPAALAASPAVPAEWSAPGARSSAPGARPAIGWSARSPRAGGERRPGPITDAEEARLARRFQAGDAAAGWDLVVAHGGFVRRFTSPYLRAGLERADLEAEAMLGLFEAARRFDPGRGVRFVTYGAYWARRALMQYLREHEAEVCIPKHQQQRQVRLRRLHERLSQDLGRPPEPSELLEAAGGPGRSRAGAMAAGDLRLGSRPSGLPVPEQPAREPDAETCLRQAELLSRLGDALPILSPREQEVLARRFGLAGRRRETLVEVAASLGLTKERVRQVETEACTMLRELLAPAAGCRNSPAERLAAARRCWRRERQRTRRS